jgi:FMN phosphatase YigB (HAD superfamily)
MSLLFVLACTTPEPGSPTPEPEPEPEPSMSGDPCEHQVEAILFDFGETLATHVGDVYEPFPDTLDTIEALQELGLPLGIVSNTEPGWTEENLRELLTVPALLDEFDLVLLSSQASSPPKPDPAIFVEAHGLLPGAPAIERVAFVTEELDHLADKPATPTEGARAAGMVGVLLAESGGPRADYVVSSLSEILTADWLLCSR